jgi:hypothetical protein
MVITYTAQAMRHTIHPTILFTRLKVIYYSIFKLRKRTGKRGKGKREWGNGKVLLVKRMLRGVAIGFRGIFIFLLRKHSKKHVDNSYFLPKEKKENHSLI